MNICVLSDFDGTITSKDGLYAFIEAYAEEGWQNVEQDWADGKISSKECLIEEFRLIPNLSEELISSFIDTLTIDEQFKSFWEYTKKHNIDFYIVSDGIDYFIDRILYKYGLSNINIISNHGEFRGESFELTFPNDNPKCINNSGTCKCSVLKNLKEKYEKIYYIGDGVSDFCVADKADILFSKSRLANYCRENNIQHIEYNNYNDVLNYFINKTITN
jgi:2-hydroxy-3-keto-5-methylthiopentenyl-1-phosphate phosphatase